MSWLYPITHNIPWFIRTPAVALLGSECYTNLIYNVQLDHVSCLKYGISKALSLAIVGGSAVVKVPQIIKIISARSARGLSLAGVMLDTLGLIIVVGYNYRHHFPITTYGESFLLLIQNVILITLIFLFSKRASAMLLATLAILIPSLMLTLILIPSSPVPPSIMQGLLTLSIPLGLSAKLPQIVVNHHTRSTGQLSSFLIISSFLGCVARWFTTLTETGDLTLLINYGCGSLLNGILMLQILKYWKAGYLKVPSSERSSPSIELEPQSASNSSHGGVSKSSHLNLDGLVPRRAHKSDSLPPPPVINLNAPKQWTSKED